jgi:hypothetical protein
MSEFNQFLRSRTHMASVQGNITSIILRNRHTHLAIKVGSVMVNTTMQQKQNLWQRYDTGLRPRALQFFCHHKFFCEMEKNETDPLIEKGLLRILNTTSQIKFREETITLSYPQILHFYTVELRETTKYNHTMCDLKFPQRC